MKAMNLHVTISPAVPAPAIAVNFSVRQIVRSDTIGTMDYAIVETAFLDGNGDPVEPPGVYNLMALDTICMHFHPASADRAVLIELLRQAHFVRDYQCRHCRSRSLEIAEEMREVLGPDPEACQ